MLTGSTPNSDSRRSRTRTGIWNYTTRKSTNVTRIQLKKLRGTRYNPEAPRHIMKNDPMSRSVYEVDPQVASAVDNEVRRQHEGLELIASENFVSEAVLEAMGSVFTNKYAEGYPGKRYYGGCEYAD